MELESDEEEKAEENGAGSGHNGDLEERSHIMEELWAEGNPFRTNTFYT
jgi:hypothetical protein